MALDIKEIRRTIQNLLPGQTYAVRVRAVNELGVYSSWSEALEFTTDAAGVAEASILDTPNAPTVLGQFGSLLILMEYTDNATGIVAYHLEHSLNGTTWESLVTRNVPFYFHAVTPDVPHYYRYSVTDIYSQSSAVSPGNSGTAIDPDDLGGSASDVAYDATSWNGSLDAPTKNVVRDKFESVVASIPSAYTDAQAKAAAVSDTAYNVGTWDSVTDVAPSKNAVRDKIETLAASIPSAYTDSQAKAAAVNDTAYNATSWDGVTDVAPSKNAVRDKIEAVVATISTAYTDAAAKAAVVDDTAYDAATWDGVTDEAPSKNAVRDKVETMQEVYVWNGSTYAPAGGRLFIGPDTEDPEDYGFTMGTGDQWSSP